jgi:hypothetical protein
MAAHRAFTDAKCRGDDTVVGATGETGEYLMFTRREAVEPGLEITGMTSSPRW